MTTDEIAEYLKRNNARLDRYYLALGLHNWQYTLDDGRVLVYRASSYFPIYV